MDITNSFSSQQRSRLMKMTTHGTLFHRTKDSTQAQESVRLLELVVDYLIRHEKKELRPGDQNGIQGYSFAWDTKILRFINSKGQTKHFEVFKIRDEDTLKILEEIRSKSVEAKVMDEYFQFIPYCKGNQKGVTALQRPKRFDRNKKLSHDLFTTKGWTNSSQAKIIGDWQNDPLYTSKDLNSKQVIDERFKFISNFIDNNKKFINEKLLEKRKMNTENYNPKIEQEIKQLENLQEQFYNIDKFALAKALLAYPVKDAKYEDLKKIAWGLQEDILKSINAKCTPQDLTYAKDVGALLFTDKTSYRKYCQNNCMNTKKESIADILIRTVLEKENATTEKPFNAKDFQKSLLLRGVSPKLKENLIKDLGYTFYKPKRIYHAEEIENTPKEISSQPLVQKTWKNTAWQVGKAAAAAVILGTMAYGAYTLAAPYWMTEDDQSPVEAPETSNESCGRQCVEEVVNKATEQLLAKIMNATSEQDDTENQLLLLQNELAALGHKVEEGSWWNMLATGVNRTTEVASRLWEMGTFVGEVVTGAMIEKE